MNLKKLFVQIQFNLDEWINLSLRISSQQRHDICMS